MSAGTILITLFFLLAPAGVLRLCRQFPTLGKIGPVLILYLLGILVGNLFHPAGMARIQQALSSAMVPLAIPLMLFSCTFRRSGTRSQLLALLSGMLAVTAAVIAGYILSSHTMRNVFQSPRFVVGFTIITIIVLVITSMRSKRENQPPASLGLPYFREER